MKLYNIELGDQEFLIQFISIDIWWAHGLHMVPLRRRQSMASAFLCRAGSVWGLVAVQPMGELCTQICRFSQGEKVAEMLLTHQVCSRFDQEGRQARWEGGLLHSWTPKCHGGGGTLLPWKPSLSNIWFWSAERLWWDPSPAFCSPGDWIFKVREQIVVSQLWWD